MRRMARGTRLGWASAARPRTALAVLLAVVLAMAPGLLRLQLRTDGHSLVPPDDPAIAIDRDARQAFGLKDPLLVVVETRHPSGIYNTATLDLVQRLTRELAAMPGLQPGDVQSLATESGGGFYPGGFQFRPLLDPQPRTPERLAEVREDVEAIDILHGTLVSHDRRATAILVGVPGPSDPRGSAVNRTALYHRVADISLRHETATDRISIVGAPAAEALLGEHILADLALLVPLALAVIAAVLWIACGRAWAALLGLAKVGAAQVFTLGLMGWCGQPVYLTTAMIPVLLTTIGLADEIHLLWHYRHRPADEPPAEALRRILGELSSPVIMTSITTAIGFLSFLTSSILPVSRFGLFTALGVLFCLLWSLVATPALLALRPEAIPAAAASASGGPRWLRGLVLALGSRPRLVLPALALVTALFVLGIPRLEIQDSWIDNFAPGSRLRQDTERVDRLFAGTHVLQAVVRFDTPADQVPVIPAASGPLLAGSAVEALGRFEAGLRARPNAADIGGVFGLHSHLLATAYLWGGRREFARTIMDNPSWIYLHVRRIGNVRGDARRTELVDDGFRRTVVTVLLKGANFRKTAAVIDEIRRLERRELAPVHARVELAGDLAVSQAMIPAIVRTQTGSLLGALAANVLILSLLCRSFRLGLACAAPTTVAVAWTFGLMGWIGLPLGVATSVFCAVTLGIGDDYCIHFLQRYRSAVAAGAERPARVAAAEAGPAVVTDALAIILGFGLLVASQVPTNRWLGLLVVFGLASACLLTLAGAGSVLELLDRRRSRSVPAESPRPVVTGRREEA
jgi:predicted RND superfamily exporter protein